MRCHFDDISITVQSCAGTSIVNKTAHDCTVILVLFNITITCFYSINNMLH